MADAVLLAVMGLALILFGLQEFLNPSKLQIRSLNVRGAIMILIGMYLMYLYAEMGQSISAPNTGYAPIGP